jgi:Reverse transcriptase (RNA-dependent DNA polymerase)
VVEPEKENSTVVEPEKENSTVVEMEVKRNEPKGGRTQAQGESRYGEVYVRRKKQNEEVVLTVSLVSSLLPLPTPTFETPTPTLETPTPSTSDSEYTGNIIPFSMVRRTSRENARVPPNWYGFPHDIAEFVSYSHISTIYEAFITSLDSISIPKYWQVAKRDLKWKTVMLEELGALEKNKTWELVLLPPDKKAVGCKWVFTVEQNPEGLIERYKAMLVAKAYSHTYGIDYDEIFAPMAKMSTVRTLVSMAVNGGWQLHQLDVKNVFLYGDLLEEVYIEIPPGFDTNQTIMGNVCRLKKSLYGLKQSPRAWFDRFRKAMIDMGYQQINADHTVFSRQHDGHIIMLVVYVDDTEDDEREFAQLKGRLGKEIEVKDLGQLRYFSWDWGGSWSKGNYSILEKVCPRLAQWDRHVGMQACGFSNWCEDQDECRCKRTGWSWEVPKIGRQIDLFVSHSSRYLICSERGEPLHAWP